MFRVSPVGAGGSGARERERANIVRVLVYVRVPSTYRLDSTCLVKCVYMYAVVGNRNVKRLCIPELPIARHRESRSPVEQTNISHGGRVGCERLYGVGQGCVSYVGGWVGAGFKHKCRAIQCSPRRSGARRGGGTCHTPIIDHMLRVRREGCGVHLVWGALVYKKGEIGFFFLKSGR